MMKILLWLIITGKDEGFLFIFDDMAPGVQQWYKLTVVIT